MHIYMNVCMSVCVCVCVRVSVSICIKYKIFFHFTINSSFKTVKQIYNFVQSSLQLVLFLYRLILHYFSSYAKFSLIFVYAMRLHNHIIFSKIYKK